MGNGCISTSNKIKERNKKIQKNSETENQILKSLKNLQIENYNFNFIQIKRKIPLLNFIENHKNIQITLSEIDLLNNSMNSTEDNQTNMDFSFRPNNNLSYSTSLAQNFSLRNSNQNKNIDFSSKFIEELNKARTDFLDITRKLENYLYNFDLFYSSIENLKIFNSENKKFFLRTKEDFIVAIDYFKDLHERNIKLEELENKEELKIQFKENSENPFDKEYLKKSLKTIEKSENKKGQFIDCHLTHFDPEISFILYITDRIKRKLSTHIFRKCSKFIRFNEKKICDESKLIYFIIFGNVALN